MIPEAAVALVALAALAYVVAPLVGAEAGRRERVAPDPADEARRSKNAALSAIVDLEREHAMGKLADEDLRALRRSLEAEALEALRVERAAEEARPVASGAEGELEREIAQARSRLRCPACGARRGAADVCPRCGAASAGSP